jgi:hypothetical protein
VVIGYRGREDSRRTGDHHQEMDPGSAYLGYRTDLGLQVYNRRQISHMTGHSQNWKKLKFTKVAADKYLFTKKITETNKF